MFEFWQQLAILQIGKFLPQHALLKIQLEKFVVVVLVEVVEDFDQFTVSFLSRQLQLVLVLGMFDAKLFFQDLESGLLIHYEGFHSEAYCVSFSFEIV